MILGPLAHFLHLCLHLLFHLCLTSSIFFHWNTSPTLLECRFSAFWVFFLFVSSVLSLLVNVFLLEAFRLHYSEPRPWQGSINVPFLEILHIQKQKASSFCYILQSSTSIWGSWLSNPNQKWLEQVTSVLKAMSLWDWFFQGHIKTHRGCACWRIGVVVLIQTTRLEDLARAAELAAILLLCHGNEGMSRTFYLSVAFVQHTVALLSPSLCHLPHGKTCQLSKQFLSLGNRPAPALLIISI